MLKQIINSAFEEAKQNQGIFRQVLSFFLGTGDPIIEALGKLDLDKASECQILKCFIRNLLKESPVTIKLYKAILSHLGIEERHEPPFTFSLQLLYQADLLTEENFDVVKQHQDICNLYAALSRLHNAVILTQENFDYLSDPKNNILLTLKIGGISIWYSLPRHLFTQDTFIQLITRASLENPEIELQRYLLGLLGNRARLNDPQTTCTVSIHNSVSAPTNKLWDDRYQPQLSKRKIEKNTTTIPKDSSNLPDTFKNKI